MKIATMPPVHPAAELFPMMTASERKALAQDIGANGLREPVIMFGAKLLDGRNRWLACQDAGVDVRLKDWNGTDPVAYVRSLNLHRRHLSPSQRAALAVKAEPVYAEAATRGRPKGGKNAVGNRPNKDDSKRALARAAKETGASLDSAKQMKQVAQSAPEVVELVQRGQVKTVADAKRLAALPEDERAEVITLLRDGRNEEDDAFSVAEALKKRREQNETPVGKVISSIENVRRCAVAIRGAVARLEAAVEEAEVTEMKSAEFTKAGIALLQARAEITAVINKLKIKER